MPDTSKSTDTQHYPIPPYKPRDHTDPELDRLLRTQPLEPGIAKSLIPYIIMNGDHDISRLRETDVYTMRAILIDLLMEQKQLYQRIIQLLDIYGNSSTPCSRDSIEAWACSQELFQISSWLHGLADLRDLSEDGLEETS